MNRKELIDVIFKNSESTTCPEGKVDCLLYESCYECCEQQLAEYEKSLIADVRSKAIDEFAEKAKDWSKEHSEWLGELDIELIARELRGQKNDER